MADKPKDSLSGSLWSLPAESHESPFVDRGLDNAPVFSPEDFVDCCEELVAPFKTPLSVEALSTPTQDR